MSHKFFVPAEQIVSNLVTLNGSDVSHIRTVLRLKVGSSIQVIVGSGKLLTVQLVDIKAREIQGEIIASEKFDVESPLEIHVGLALTKGNKLDATLRKTVELGASSITPLITERCEVKIRQVEKKTERWKKIVLESSKQCGRNKIPLVTEGIGNLETFCCNSDERELKMLFWESEYDNSLKDIKLDRQPRSVAILIGPEGGFSLTEVKKTREYGFQTASLGPRILRAETAPVVALTLLQSIWGDL